MFIINNIRCFALIGTAIIIKFYATYEVSYIDIICDCCGFNEELINQYEKLIRVLKKYFDYEYYDQNSFGMEFFTGKKDKMLQSLSEI